MIDCMSSAPGPSNCGFVPMKFAQRNSRVASRSQCWCSCIAVKGFSPECQRVPNLTQGARVAAFLVAAGVDEAIGDGAKVAVVDMPEGAARGPGGDGEVHGVAGADV